MFDINANDTLTLLKPFAQWMHDHVLIAGLLTCFISFLESLAVIGYLIPGSIIMPAIGILVGAGILPAADIFFWAILGAILGDGVSFWLGYHYHSALREMWPMRHYPALLQRSEVFFKTHGGKSVFIGRFVGAVRPMVPVVAGMMNMSPWRFYTANVLSALIWAPAFLLPGVLLGAASMELPAKVATQFILLLFAGLVTLGLSMWLFKWCIHQLQHILIVWLSKTWMLLHRRPLTRPLCKLIRDPSQPYKHGQFSISLVLLVAVCAFIGLLSLPLTAPETIAINPAVDYLFKGLRTPWLDNLAAWFTLLANRNVVAIPVGVCCLWLWWRSERVAALHLAGAALLCVITVAEFKMMIAGSRPPDIGVGNTHASYGFPSGHTTLAVVLYSFMALLISRSWPKTWKKQLLYTGLVSFISLSAITRLYLGAHWFTDVLGGVLLGVSIVALIALSYRRYPVQTVSHRLLASLAGASLLITALVSGGLHPDRLKRYQFSPTPQPLRVDHWWQQQSASPPIYVRNRLGRIDSLVNIQWVGPLAKIESTLTQLGWQTKPSLTWESLLARLNPDIDEVTLPLIAKQFQHQNPVLALYKPSTHGMPVQLLHLWPATHTLVPTRNQQTLWFGQIEPYVPTHHVILKRKKMQSPTTLPAWYALAEYIPASQRRIVTYHSIPLALKKRGITTSSLLINQSEASPHAP